MKRIFYIFVFVFFSFWSYNECQNSHYEEATESSNIKTVNNNNNSGTNSSGFYNNYDYTERQTADDSYENVNIVDQNYSINDEEENSQENYNINTEDNYVPEYDNVEQESGIRIGAMCEDGTDSNATGRGACSHHGGVEYWIYE